MDEARLIDDAVRGDLDAFNHLILAYQDLAYNLAYRILSDEAAADDAVQTAFIAAYSNLSSLRGGSFKSWLLRIITNTCYDELRRRHRRPTVPLEPTNSGDDEENESPFWLAEGSPSPEGMLEIKELDLTIQSCIARLPEKFRPIVIMVDVQGFDYAEASKAVGEPLGTVKSRLARARLRLRDCLSASNENISAPVNNPDGLGKVDPLARMPA